MEAERAWGLQGLASFVVWWEEAAARDNVSFSFLVPGTSYSMQLPAIPQIVVNLFALVVVVRIFLI